MNIVLIENEEYDLDSLSNEELHSLRLKIGEVLREIKKNLDTENSKGNFGGIRYWKKKRDTYVDLISKIESKQFEINRKFKKQKVKSKKLTELEIKRHKAHKFRGLTFHFYLEAKEVLPEEVFKRIYEAASIKNNLED